MEKSKNDKEVEEMFAKAPRTTKKMLKELKDAARKHFGAICSVCQSCFDIENEGGAEGYFGILPVTFCPTCYACMVDMVDVSEEED